MENFYGIIFFLFVAFFYHLSDIITLTACLFYLVQQATQSIRLSLIRILRISYD